MSTYPSHSCARLRVAFAHRAVINEFRSAAHLTAADRAGALLGA